jgi:hypothetical protein
MTPLSQEGFTTASASLAGPGVILPPEAHAGGFARQEARMQTFVLLTNVRTATTAPDVGAGRR